MKKTLLKILTILGILMVAVALFGLRQLNEPLVHGIEIAIEVPGDDTLVGTYYPGRTDQAVLLLEGFGSDQTALRPIAADFAGRGLHVLTFDFSGHGRSPGGLDFDNASTDRMAKQVLAADAKLRQLSGLSHDQIIHLGHSLGARVALQAATMTDTPPSLLILLGTQVNLATNQQAEFFTGTSDADVEWVQALGPENPDTNIVFFSGVQDDILTPESASLLVEKTTGKEISTSTAQVYQVQPLRYLEIRENLLHNYEIYADLTPFWLLVSLTKSSSDNGSFGGDLPPEEQIIFFQQLIDKEFERLDNVPPRMNLLSSRIYLWFLGIAGLFLALIAGNALTERHANPAPDAAVTWVRRFIGGKLLLWVPALIPGALIASAVFFAPLGTPAFNLYYIGFFGGYGVLLWFLYRKGKMPGVEGRLTLKGNPQADPQRAYLGGLVFVLVLLAVSLMARSGWWYTFPLNHRFIWLLAFTPITALGFMIGFKEIEMLRAFQPGRRWLVWVNALVGLFPFFLYTTFLASLGSLSGVVSSLQGLLILALAIVTGALVEKLSARPWMAALMQAFLLYWLILPPGVLFR